MVFSHAELRISKRCLSLSRLLHHAESCQTFPSAYPFQACMEVMPSSLPHTRQ